jgi:hypothetical protein
VIEVIEKIIEIFVQHKEEDMKMIVFVLFEKK